MPRAPDIIQAGTSALVNHLKPSLRRSCQSTQATPTPGSSQNTSPPLAQPSLCHWVTSGARPLPLRLRPRACIRRGTLLSWALCPGATVNHADPRTRDPTEGPPPIMRAVAWAIAAMLLLRLLGAIPTRTPRTVGTGESGRGWGGLGWCGGRGEGGQDGSRGGAKSRGRG